MYIVTFRQDLKYKIFIVWYYIYTISSLLHYFLYNHHYQIRFKWNDQLRSFFAESNVFSNLLLFCHQKLKIFLDNRKQMNGNKLPSTFFYTSSSSLNASRSIASYTKLNPLFTKVSSEWNLITNESKVEVISNGFWKIKIENNYKKVQAGV